MIRIFKLDAELTSANMVYSITDAHTDMIRDLKFSPNVLDDFYTLASCSEDGCMILMTLPMDMNRLSSLEDGEAGHTVIRRDASSGNRDPIWRLCWNLSGRVVSGVSLGENKKASVVSFVKKAENEWDTL